VGRGREPLVKSALAHQANSRHRCGGALFAGVGGGKIKCQLYLPKSRPTQRRRWALLMLLVLVLCLAAAVIVGPRLIQAHPDLVTNTMDRVREIVGPKPVAAVETAYCQLVDLPYELRVQCRRASIPVRAKSGFYLMSYGRRKAASVRMRADSTSRSISTYSLGWCARPAWPGPQMSIGAAKAGT
jgi:hypothetical protein